MTTFGVGGHFGHLKEGDPEPAVDSEKYILYGFRFCPCTERVQLVLNYHNIEYDVIFISLSSKPDWFLKLSPDGKLPLLCYKGEKLFDSDRIMRFLDDLAGPEKSLLAGVDKRTFLMAIDLADQYYTPAHAILFRESYNRKCAELYRAGCVSIQIAVQNRFLSGESLSLADLALFPMVDHFEVIQARIDGHPPLHEVCEMSGMPNENDPLAGMKRYIMRVRHQLALLGIPRKPTRLIGIFVASVRAGNPDPDVLLCRLA